MAETRLRSGKEKTRLKLSDRIPYGLYKGHQVAGSLPAHDESGVSVAASQQGNYSWGLGEDPIYQPCTSASAEPIEFGVSKGWLFYSHIF